MSDLDSNYFWTTKDGETLHITEMETSHIENCLRLIERNNFSVTIEMGSMGFDGEGYYDYEERNLRPVYENMKIELRLRRLEARAALEAAREVE